MGKVIDECMQKNGPPTSSRINWRCTAAGAAVGLCVLVRVLYFYHASDAELIAAVPDDAFYYIQMARHRAVDGFWTFDGTSPATGFHFLYGYLLTALFWLFGIVDWRQLFLLIGGGASVSIGLAAGLVARSAENFYGRKAILLAVAPFLSPVALIQSTAMMESWLVLFFSAATIYVLVKDKNSSPGEGIALLILGALGSLSRTDYGMLPGALFLAGWISRPLLRGHYLKRSALVLAGAVLGVTIVLLQNLHISGHLFQASAQTKLHWSSVLGHSFSPPVNLTASVALPFMEGYGQTMKVAALLATLPFLLYSWRIFAREDPGRRDHTRVVVSGCLLTVLGYILLYRQNSQALWSWYSCNLIAPIGIILAAAGYPLARMKTLLPTGLVFGGYVLMGAASLITVQWPHQAGMMKAGLFLKQHDPRAICASWNAGIISYFSGLPLVNIDGITTDEVLPFIANNNLFDYIKLRDIRYVIDYEEMFKNPARRVRGGFVDPRMDRCLRPLEAIDGDSPVWWGSRVRMYEVVRGCD